MKSFKADAKIQTMIVVSMVMLQVTYGIITVPGTPGTKTPMKTLDIWCTNLTQHLITTMQQYGGIGFNKSSQLMSTGITEAQRLAYDRRDLQIYSLFLDEVIPDINTTLSLRLRNCFLFNKGGINILVMWMKLSELYLNGTIPSPPNISISTVRLNLRYQHIATNMAILKAKFRKLAEIFGKAFTTSVIIR